ncbi:MAG TPA: hypothetical protein VGP04_21695 [Pseudonocardiaceae bacterium]|nr:hypothetical protein [Pseudonocardiaceae bacterium]
MKLGRCGLQRAGSRNRVRAIGGLDCGHPVEDVGEPGRQVYGDSCRPVQAGAGALYAGSGVFTATGECFKQDQTQGVDISGGTDQFATDPLGRQVGRSADYCSGEGNSRDINEQRDPEVSEQRTVMFVKKNVGGLDVAVDYPLGVDVGQGVSQLSPQWSDRGHT